MKSRESNTEQVSVCRCVHVCNLHFSVVYNRLTVFCVDLWSYFYKKAVLLIFKDVINHAVSV